MRSGIQALTEKEKEALRLLLAGHDAKSIASALSLSVHTANERLRDARRKLGASSSREAARRLAEADGHSPDNSRDNAFGVAGSAAVMRRDEQPHRRPIAGNPLAWLSGGMLIMSLVIAAVALSFAFNERTGPEAPQAQRLAWAGTEHPSAESAAVSRARQWVALVDAKRWDESWRTASVLFNGQLSAAQWEAAAVPVRKPLGAVLSRTVQSVTQTNSLPGAPAGEYQVIQFKTDFAGKTAAIETVFLAHEASDWKVAGYFIR